jgi:DNA-binding SARP family transcriptional activator/TolB-like protein
MLSLHLLGGLMLDGPGVPSGGPVTQRKRLALLALLAVAPDQRLARDKLLAYLWPESPTDRARHQLSSAVYEIRKVAGEDAIGAVGDELRLSCDAVRVDALEFEAAIEQGDHARAVTLYKGPYLDGFFLRDAAEFERWMERERERFAGCYARALEELAECAEAEGDPKSAVEHWKARAALDRFDSRIAVRLMRALEASGNRAAALQHAAVHERLLHEDFGMKPDSKVASLAEQLRGAGVESAAGDAVYPATASKADQAQAASRDFEAEARDSSPSTTWSAKNDDAGDRLILGASPPGSHRRRNWRLRHWATAFGLVLGALATVLATLWLSQPGPRTPDTRRIQVATFENRTGDPALDYLGSMATDRIAQGLSHAAISDVTLVSTVAALPGHPSNGNNGPAEPLATESAASLVVSGAYYRVGDSIQFYAQIIDAREQSLLRGLEPVSAHSSGQGAAIETLGRRVAGAVAIIFDTRLARIGKSASPPSNYEAYHAWLEGLDPFFAADWPAATRHFERSLELDPTYLFALLHIGYVRLNVGDLTGADSIVTVLNGSRERMMPFELAVLDLLQAYVARDPVASYEAARRAATAAPGSPPHVQWGGEALRLNRPRDAIRILSAIDPYAAPIGGWPLYWEVLTSAHHSLGRHRQELKEARRARALYPDQPWAFVLEARALAALGRLRELDALIDARRSLPDQRHPQLGPLQEVAARELRAHGHEGAAANMFDRALTWYRARPAEERSGPDYAMSFALALLAAGRLDEVATDLRRLALDNPEDVAIQGAAGVLAARRGSRAEAGRIADWLTDSRLPYQRGRTYAWRGCIAGHLGEHDRALALLQEAAGRSERFDHTHFCLDSLRDYPQFRDWMRPKG